MSKGYKEAIYDGGNSKARKHIERYAGAQVTREMQIISKTRYNFISILMAKIKKEDNTKH